MKAERFVFTVSRRLVLAALMITTPGIAFAQGDYPTRTVKMIVPLPPGGIADTLPRIVADKLTARWGHPVIIETRPGAAHHIGAEAAAKAERDGYTLFATPSGPLVVSQHLYQSLAFDSTAFVPVSIVGTVPAMLVAHPNAPFSTLPELIAYAKAQPGNITYGSPGTGTSLHLIGEMLQTATGMKLTHVPYRGMAPAVTDLLGGQIAMTVDVLANALPHVKSGKLKALSVASKERIPELPDIPAIAETIPDFVFIEWFAVVAPPKTPAGIVVKLSQATAEAVRLPEVRQRFSDFSVTPAETSPAETAAFLRQESERWRKVVAATGIKLD